MLKRIISGIIAFLVFVPVVWFSQPGTPEGWVFPIAISIATAIALGEMFNCIGILKMWYLSIPLILVGAAIPVLARFFDGGRENELHTVVLMIVIALVTYILAVSLFSKGRFPIELAGLAFTTEFYICGGFTSIVLF